MKYKIDFKKTNSLPSLPQKNTLYFIENGDYAETFLTDNNGTPKKVGNTLMINEVVSAQADVHFEHHQSTPSSTWSINHMLNKFPSVSIVDTSGNVVYGDIQHIDNNNLTINYSAAFSGKAYLN